jgi:hypothetical protein
MLTQNRLREIKLRRGIKCALLGNTLQITGAATISVSLHYSNAVVAVLGALVWIVGVILFEVGSPSLRNELDYL